MLRQAREIGVCLQCRRQPEAVVLDAYVRRPSQLGSITVGAQEVDVFDVVSLPIPLCEPCATAEKRRQSTERAAHIGLFVGGVVTTILFQAIFKPTWAPWWTAGAVMGLCYAIAMVFDARRMRLVELHPATEVLARVGYKPSSASSMTPADAYRHLIEADPTSVAASQAERSLIQLSNSAAIAAARTLEDDPSTRPAALRILAALGEYRAPTDSCSDP